MAKKRKRDIPICEMTFAHLNEYRWRRKERFEIAGLIIIEERPENYFSEEEWHQFFIDDFTAHFCIERDLPVPEDVEIRLLKAMKKIRYYMGTS